MSGYIGTQPVPQATQTRDSFTATSGHTSFATGGYTPQFLSVYLNGIFLSNGADYTATNGSDVILASGAATGDILEVVAYSTFEVLNPTFGGNVTLDNNTGSPNQTLMLLQADMGTNNRNMQIKSPATDSTSAPFRFTTGNSFAFEIDSTTDALVIDASARIGIGTDTPDTLMELVGANPILTIRDTETGVSANDARLRLAESGASSSLDNYFDLGYVSDKFTIGSNSVADALTINRENGNVGINTASPTASLHVTVSGTDNLTGVLIESTDAGTATAPDLTLYRKSASPADNDSLGTIWFYGKNSTDEAVQYCGIFASSADVTDGTEDGELRFYTRSDGAQDEAMRINSSRDLMVGNTTTPYTLYTGNNTATKSGVGLRSEGYIAASRMDDFAMQLNRMGANGDILGFRKNGTDVGAIGIGSSLYIDGGQFQAGLQFRASDIIPRDNGSLVDNSIDLGDGAYRFDDIYAGNTSIIGTSDITEKQDIASLTATEMLVAARLSKLFKTFRWKDSVAEKGDNARTHTGTMAQEVQSSFTEEGLDAGDYSLFVSNTWWTHDVEVPAVEAVAEVTDEDGNVTTEAVEAVDSYTRTDTYKTEAEAPEGATSKTRLGLRYTELLAFVSAYNEQRFATLEANQTAIEARLTALEAV
jgi:hypothetical protein